MSYASASARRRPTASRSVGSLGRLVCLGRAFTTCWRRDLPDELIELFAGRHRDLLAGWRGLRRTILSVLHTSTQHREQAQRIRSLSFQPPRPAKNSSNTTPATITTIQNQLGDPPEEGKCPEPASPSKTSPCSRGLMRRHYSAKLLQRFDTCPPLMRTYVRVDERRFPLHPLQTGPGHGQPQSDPGGCGRAAARGTARCPGGLSADARSGWTPL